MTQEEFKYIESIIVRDIAHNDVASLKKIKKLIDEQMTNQNLVGLMERADILTKDLLTFLNESDSYLLKRQRLTIIRALTHLNLLRYCSHFNLYVFDLVKYTEKELLESSGVGSETLNAIQIYLNANGLKLGMPITINEEKNLLNYLKKGSKTKKHRLVKNNDKG